MENGTSRSPAGPGRGWIGGVFAITLLIYALWTPGVLRYTQPPSGDQPYYLQTVISLLEDHDLNEYNNYNESASYDQFYPLFGGDYPSDFEGILAPYPLPHEGHIVTTSAHAENEWYSKHGLGVPLLIIPGWVIGKALTPLLAGLTLNGGGGWPGVVFEYNLLGALLAVQVFLLAWETTGKRWIALVVWATLAFSNPQMSYSYLIFPELPAALLVIYAFRRLRLGWAANRLGQLWLVGLSLAYLPWLHYRLAPIVVGLGLYGLHQRRAALRGQTVSFAKRVRALVPLLGPLVVSIIAMMVYDWWVCGSIVPDFQDHAGFFSPFVSQERMAEFLSLVGLSVDRGWGLLTYSPVFVLAWVGVFWLRRSREGRSLLGWFALIVVPYFMVVADYQVWWGAWCPPARYLAPITPLLALPLATALANIKHKTAFRLLYALLAGVSITVMIAMLAHLDYKTADHVPMLFNLSVQNVSFFSWLQAQVGLDLGSLFPVLTPCFLAGGCTVLWSQIWGVLSLVGVLLVAGLLCLGSAKPATQENPGVRTRRPGLRSRYRNAL